jgi:hypothetical protein
MNRAERGLPMYTFQLGMAMFGIIAETRLCQGTKQNKIDLGRSDWSTPEVISRMGILGEQAKRATWEKELWNKGRLKRHRGVRCDTDITVHAHYLQASAGILLLSQTHFISSELRRPYFILGCPRALFPFPCLLPQTPPSSVSCYLFCASSTAFWNFFRSMYSSTRAMKSNAHTMRSRIQAMVMVTRVVSDSKLVMWRWVRVVLGEKSVG